MLNTFGNDKATSRRLERERQLELMNHAANGTGPFAAEALDTNWDVSGALDIDESLALDLEHPSPTAVQSRSGRGGGGDSLSPERARAAALAALEHADRVSSRSLGVEESRKTPSSTGSSRTSRFLWSGDDSSSVSGAKHRSNANGAGRDEFTIEEEDNFTDVVSSQRRLSPKNNNGDTNHGNWMTRTQYGTVGGRPITRRIILIALACLLGLIVIIAVATSSSKKKQDRQVDNVAATSTGDVNTASVSSANANAIEQLLLAESVVVDSSIFSDSTSPQARAVDWMSSQSHTVNTALNVGDGNGPDEDVIKSLFGLATFYYATIENSPEFAAGTSGEGFEGGRNHDVDGDNDLDPAYSHQGMDWLSEYPDAQTSQVDDDGFPSYCHWTGVECLRQGSAPGMPTGSGVVKELNVTQRGLNGHIPDELPVALGHLDVLDLGYNYLTGTIPATIGAATLLTQLYLGGNQLQGSIPETIGLLVELEDLYLHENFLTDSIPDTIGNLINLDGLGLYENQLSGPIPDTIGNLAGVYVLYLDDNKLTGNIPSTVGQLTSCADLRLRKNRLSGGIPAEIADMQSLELLYLDDNQLSGPIPDSIGEKLQGLTQLHLYKNGLGGPIPSNLGQLQNLALLYLDNNEFSGPIPPELGQLTSSLESLYLFSNLLDGPLPTQLGDLAQLKSLRLNDNGITGPVPPELGGLARLELLYLDDNALTGVGLPTQLDNLVQLQKFRINGNGITGSISETVCWLVTDGILSEFVTDSCGDGAPVSCDCCTCPAQ